jgi:hypothetical protein
MVFIVHTTIPEKNELPKDKRSVPSRRTVIPDQMKNEK